jgi:hypothetical protein
MDKMERAEQVYQLIKSHLNSKNIRFDPHDDDKVITMTAQGDDLPMPVVIRVIGEREVLHIVSPLLAGKFPEDKRIDAAVALAAINNHLMNGSFDLDLDSGLVTYRVCQSFHDNDISEEQIHYLLAIVFITTDEYNDTLFMLAKGNMTLEQVLEKVKR